MNLFCIINDSSNACLAAYWYLSDGVSGTVIGIYCQSPVPIPAYYNKAKQNALSGLWPVLVNLRICWKADKISLKICIGWLEAY